MNNAAINEDEDKPLDPALERVRRKMIRLLVISIGIMMIGVMALLFGIVYKIKNKTASAAPATSLSVPNSSEEMSGIIALPEGAQVNSHSLSGGQILIDITLADGKREMVLFDIAQGRIVRRFDVQNVK